MLSQFTIIDTVIQWTTHHSLPFAVAGGVVAVILVVRAIARTRPVPTDPTRLFSAVQRSEGFARAGGRCEFDKFWLVRCKRPAQHGDHHYPWSRGGATTMGNFTAACSRCNTSKGAKIPTNFSTMRLESRRRKYFPVGIMVTAGERFANR